MGDLGDLDVVWVGVEQIKLIVEVVWIIMMFKCLVYDEVWCEGESCIVCSQQVYKEINGWKYCLEIVEKCSFELFECKVILEGELVDVQVVFEEIVVKCVEFGVQIEDLEKCKGEVVNVLFEGESVLCKVEQGEWDVECVVLDVCEVWVWVEVLVDVVLESVMQVVECIQDEMELMFEGLLKILDLVLENMFLSYMIEGDVNCLKCQWDVLGVVNLCVEEDVCEVQEEYDILVNEKQDFEDVIWMLCFGIVSLNFEGCECLLMVFEQVNGNFVMLFKYFFGGGEVNFVMVESEDLLDVGFEIMCQLSGKKFLILLFLLGGEQMLMVLVLIFVVFFVNFVLICVLDEVDVFLDDVNVMWFCDMLDEMCCQIDMWFLIIIYYVVMMVWMDWLFGVIMQEQGVSQFVFVDLKVVEMLVV